MRKILLGPKIKGVIEVLSSHLLVLMITMLISFILPLKISVEEYGKWQLFSLIIGYAGFFALGFNDGIHINYSGLEYDNDYHYKFRGFRRFIDLLSILATSITLLVVFVFKDALNENYVVYLLSALNIIPVLVNGFFAYVNQGTMRFSYFAKANLLEKIFYLVMMVALLVFGVKEALYYMLTYTFARYLVILYNRITSKELYGSPIESYSKLRPEIKQNFISGFVLMIATLCNQSIIVPGRLLVENQYGLVAFSCYSFAIHTMVIANQITTALSQVFFPAMKRAQHENFNEVFTTIDKAIGVLSIVLLISYFPVYGLIKLAYPNYSQILDYLFCLYPLFMMTSKSAILIINTYKMDSDNKKLLTNNAIGVAINAIVVLIAHLLFGTVSAVAFASLVGYVAWYYYCYLQLLRERQIGLGISNFVDLIVIVAFILMNLFLKSLIVEQWIYLGISAGVYVVCCVIAFLTFKRYFVTTTKKFITYMNK